MTAYKATLRQLSTPSLYGEVIKLENSIIHLRRSNDELKTHGETEEEASWVGPIIAENEQVIAKQLNQVELVKAEIVERGAWSEHAQGNVSNGNGVGEDLTMREGELNREHREGDEDEDRMQVDEINEGMHL